MRGLGWSSLILVVLLVTGCSSTRQGAAVEQDYVAPMSIYSVMDATSLVYSDPQAAAPLNDDPRRWLGFFLHPVGQLLDYTINRPLRGISSTTPYVFGYTAEDAMVDSQRR
jgi:hypothetical protein